MRRFATAVAVVGLIAAVAGPVAVAAEPSCPPAAGDHTPFDRVVAPDGQTPKPGELDPARLDPDAPDHYDLILNGGGWGHGIGMSQYGARGAAILGCTHQQILETYFPGAKVGTDDTTATTPIRVGLWPSTPKGGPVTVINVDNVGEQPVPWSLSPADETDGSPPEQPVGARWTVRAEPGGGFTIREGAAADAPVIWPDDQLAGGYGSRLRADLAGSRVYLSSKAKSYQRGTLEFASTDQSGGGMLVVAELPSIEQYLYGLGEVPSSWPAETLAAQAVAGRSYALTTFPRPNCLCDLYDSTYDQAYVGAAKETGTDGDKWVAAVDATAGQILSYDYPDDDQGPKVVRAYYSSSNGGMSSAAWDIWGSDPDIFPYLAPVDTSAWEQVDDDGDGQVDNARHRWSVGFTAAQLATAFQMDEVTSVEIRQRAPGGRPCLATSKANPCDPQDLDGDGKTEPVNGVVVTGTIGGEIVHKTYSSEGFRGALGLWSGLVGVDGQEPPFAPPPVTVRRRAGIDRVGTAIQLSRSGWDTSDVVLLARSDDPSDALAGSALAGALDAPLLLTPSTALLDTVKAELARLGATKVVLLGGTAAISDDVATALQDLGLDVDRVAGADRFATAVEVARRLAPDAGGTALLVRGAFAGHPERSWPDALAVSGLAARKAAAGTPWPILATAGELPDATRSALDELGITTVKIIGGTAVIDAATESALTDAGFQVERIGGQDRYGTSRLVAATDDPSGQQLVLATGQDFPDGLASGPFAARTGAVLLLVPKDLNLDASPWGPDEHPAYLQGLGWSQSVVTVAGGSAAITDPVADHVKAILKGATPSATATASPSPSGSASPTATTSPSPSPSPSPSTSPSPSPSPSPSAS